MDGETRAIYRNQMFKDLLAWLRNRSAQDSAAITPAEFAELAEEAVEAFKDESS